MHNFLPNGLQPDLQGVSSFLYKGFTCEYV